MELFDYLKRGVTPYHTVAASEAILRGADFSELALEKPFPLAAGGRYYVKIFSTAIAAFTIGKEVQECSPFHIAAAHTDHPCLHVKPDFEYSPAGNSGYMRLNCEIYGGPIYSTWLDRRLSVAGLVVLKGDDSFAP